MRLRATHLDVWRFYQRSGPMTHEQLVARLRGESKPTRQMRVGTAFHAAMQGWLKGDA